MADTSTQNNTIQIDVAETSAISAAVTEYWDAWPEKPAPVSFQFLPGIGPACTIAQLQGVHQLKRSVTGKITSQYMYQLIYRDTPQTSTDRINMDAVMMDAALYAESHPITIGSDRTVTRHCAQSMPIPMGRLENGSEDWAITFVLEYTHYNKKF